MLLPYSCVFVSQVLEASANYTLLPTGMGIGDGGTLLPAALLPSSLLSGGDGFSMHPGSLQHLSESHLYMQHEEGGAPTAAPKVKRRLEKPRISLRQEENIWRRRLDRLIRSIINGSNDPALQDKGERDSWGAAYGRGLIQSLPCQLGMLRCLPQAGVLQGCIGQILRSSRSTVSCVCELHCSQGEGVHVQRSRWSDAELND